VPSRPGAWGAAEYVSGTPNVRLSVYAQALPWYLDDVTRDFGDDLYERMLNDAQVYSCVEILKLSVLGEGYRLKPAAPQPRANPAKEPGQAKSYSAKEKLDYDLACEVCSFCQDNLDGLYHSGGKPFEAFLYEMTEALALGNKVAEKVYRDENHGADPYPRLKSRTGGRAVLLDRVKVKPRRTVRFVVNAFLDVVGIQATIPGRSESLAPYGFYGGDPAKSPTTLPREKFVIFTYNPHDNDPRGRSVLRPAYDPWWNKTSAKPEYAKYLAQFGGPSLFGTTPEDVPGDLDADTLGNATGLAVDDPLHPDPGKKLLRVLQALRNGYVAVGPAGTEVKVIQAGGTGAAFTAAFDFWDKQIAKAVLGQTLATEEGEHQARAAAEVHENVLGISFKHARRSVSTMVRNDLLFHLVAYNYGDAVARHYTPLVEVGPQDEDDWSADVQGVTALVGAAGGAFIDKSQYPYLYEKLNLPQPSPSAPSGDPGAGGQAPPGNNPATPPQPPGNNPAAPPQKTPPPGDGKPPAPAAALPPGKPPTPRMAGAQFSRGRGVVTAADLTRARCYLEACRGRG
jgi:hypothetical protein